MGVDFEVITKNIDEIFPKHISAEKTAEYLAEKKADAFNFTELPPNATLITCDTTVVVDNEILGKANSSYEAKNMLQKLSGRKHLVITGVCLRKNQKKMLFSETTTVYFKKLTKKQIDHYIQTYKPFDKAGAYGIQEWIGMIGISRIEGCYYNVMGLPTSKLFDMLQNFEEEK